MNKECSSCSKSAGCASKVKNAQGQEVCGSAEDKDAKLHAGMAKIKHKLVVLSGKGGVGKSTAAVNIALSLALAGKKVGLLDVDIHGPSVPRLLSLQGSQPHMEKDYIEPVPWSRNLWVMSTAFLIPNDREAVIWRAPVKMGLIRQYLENVAWGELDFLVVDCPPGTGDEPLTVLQLLGPEALAVIVTTPQNVAVDDVRRSVTFAQRVGNPVLGIIENMSGFVCPDCGKTHNIFQSGGGEKLAAEMGVPFLGRLPIDPELGRAGEEGFAYPKVFPETATAEAMRRIVAPMLALPDPQGGPAA